MLHPSIILNMLDYLNISIKMKGGNKMRKILIIGLAIMFLFLSNVSAYTTRVHGDVNLVWTNAYNRPQVFSGTITGGLVGNISLTTNTYYDTSSTNVGVTDSENVFLELRDMNCEGFYSGANVNAGRNSGTFTLFCDSNDTIQGIMYGVNDELGNIKAKYDLFITTTPQIIKGDKGDTGTCTCDLTKFNTLLNNMNNYPGFSDFFAWTNRECNNGAKQCSGTSAQICVNYHWVTQNCKNGCTSGSCIKCPSGWNYHADNVYCDSSHGYTLNGYYSNVCRFDSKHWEITGSCQYPK
jgi:hypothetical protein